MSISSTNLSGNNVTAFNRHRRLAAQRARAEAEAEAQRAKRVEQKPKKRETKPVKPEVEAPKSELVSHEPFSDAADAAVDSEPEDGE